MLCSRPELEPGYPGTSALKPRPNDRNMPNMVKRTQHVAPNNVVRWWHYVKVVDWFNAELNCSFSPTPLETLFGTDLATSRNNELKFSYCLLFAKYYLYYQKMYHKTCNFTEFVLKLEQKLLIESRLERKLRVWKCFRPLSRLVSIFVFFCNNVLCSTTLFFVLC